MSAGEWEDLVPFDIYANDGGIYRLFVTQKEKNATEGNAVRTLRLLERLKASGQKPIGKWDESLGFGNDADSSEWLPAAPVGTKTAAAVPSKSCGAIPKTLSAPGHCTEREKPKRATGKTGGVWPREKTHVFLATCLPYAEQLRCSAVPESVWQHISDVLFAMDCHELNYSSQQLREKMRTLKCYFSNTKSGKHGGSRWEFFSLMRDLFDRDLTDADSNPSMAYGVPYVPSDSLGGRDINANSANDHVPNPPEYELFDVDFLTASVDGDGLTSLSHGVDLQATNLKDEAEGRDINFNVSGGHVHTKPGHGSVSSTFNASAVHDSTTIPDQTVMNCDESSDSDLDIDIVNLSMSPKPGSTMVDNDTAARLIPYSIANRNIRSNLKKNVVGPKVLFSEGSAETQSETISDKTTYSNFDRSNLMSSTPTKSKSPEKSTAAETVGSPSSKSFRSPPPKKTGSGRAVYSPNKAKIPRTPKRRIGACHLIWESAVTDMFMDACLRRKEDMQGDNIPVSVWKEIHEELLSKDQDKSWEMIRAKFENMKNYFSRALEHGSKQGGIVWPYFNKFCQIYDLDCESDTSVLTEAESKKFWIEKRERLLFNLYIEKMSEFESSKCPIRHSTLYQQIATTMNLHDVPVTGTQCKAHMKKLLHDFHEAYDRGTGKGGIEFPYFEEFLDIFKGTPSLQPPACVSVGRGLSLTIEGKKVGELQSHSCTRQRFNNKPSKATYNYRSATVPQAPPQDRLAEEVKRMTDIYDKKSDAKLALFKELVSNFKPKE